MKFRANDEQAREVIEADSLAEALETAADLWKDGSWDGKSIVTVRVTELDADGDDTDNADSIDVEVGDDPEAPECTDGQHDWQSPYPVVGGIDSNPGVWSKGGTTMVYKTCCAKCGVYRVETHYGSQRNHGQCDQVEFVEADESSLAWVAENA